MGLFDYVKCVADLPNADKSLQKKIFQTKDFECFLDIYTITKEGRLICKSGKKTKVIPHHGDIRFYTTTGNREDNTYKWHEYMARFTHGKLEYIKQVRKS